MRPRRARRSRHETIRTGICVGRLEGSHCGIPSRHEERNGVRERSKAFIIDQRQKFFGCVGIAFIDRMQNAREIAHPRHGSNSAKICRDQIERTDPLSLNRCGHVFTAVTSRSFNWPTFLHCSKTPGWLQAISPPETFNVAGPERGQPCPRGHGCPHSGLKRAPFRFAAVNCDDEHRTSRSVPPTRCYRRAPFPHHHYSAGSSPPSRSRSATPPRNEMRPGQFERNECIAI